MEDSLVIFSNKSMSNSLSNSEKMDEKIHLWRMGFFGAVSAIPLAFLLSVVTFWLTDYGCSPIHMGMMAWMMIPYALKIFLGPFVQMTSFGPLGRRYGHYRIWIVMAQLGVVGCILTLSFVHPLHDWRTALGVCFFTALCGAVQDCALEGYRVNSTPQAQQSAISGSNAMGYRIGMWATTCLAMIFAEYSWFSAFSCIAVILIILSTLCLWRLPQPTQWREMLSVRQYFLLLKQGWNFFYTRYFFLSVLGMIAAHKLGDVFLRSMWSHYLIKAGYTKHEIVTVDKGFGIIATIIGIRFGVAWINRKGIASGFRLWAVLQGFMAFLFVMHAWFGGTNFALFFSSVSFNHLVGGIGNVTIVTYLSNLCKTNDQRDTLHYAMLSSLGSLGRTVVSATACLTASVVSWPAFFMISALMCLPALILSCLNRPFHKRTKAHDTISLE